MIVFRMHVLASYLSLNLNLLSQVPALQMATLLDCSAEIHQLIYQQLKTRTARSAFIATCRTLYRAFRVRFICDVLQRDFVRGKEVAGFTVKVHEEIQKYRPVVVVGVRTEGAKKGEGKQEEKGEEFKTTENRIIVSCYLPRFFPRSSSSSRDGDLKVEGNEVTVYSNPDGDYEDNSDEDEDSEDEGSTFEFVLTRERAANMVRMTGSMLRQHWGDCCPECGGGRSICPGCGGVSKRWESCFASCGYSMPCPSCIGYGWAMDFKDLMRYADEEPEELDEVWQQLDEMDGGWLKK
ncbi:hypothetical protein FB451DRAFT_1566839 [Mycena latifolia]|nr:hypothetical protein FB451DRAFT_1566839 [Mycena latifolia]